MTLILGSDWQRELFTSPYWLRFQLARGGSDVSRFVSAYDRARALARAALPGDNPYAIVAAYPKPSTELGAQARGRRRGDAFGLLDQMGIATAPFEASWLGYVHPGEEADEEAQPWEHRALRLGWEQADILLWSNIAQDMGVAPRAPVLSKLVDPERGVVVYAYDDRGMDITALSAEPLADLYASFSGWLLDHDRPRMREVFEGV